MSMTNISAFCLVVSSLPLAWPPPKPQQSNGTVKGRRQDVPTSCSRALEARLMSISNLTPMRRPVDGSGNEARHSLPPTRDRDNRFPRYWTTLQPIRRRADESCKQTGRHHSNDPFHPTPPRQPSSRCRKVERKGDEYSEGVLSRTMSFELLHLRPHLPLYILQSINSGLLI